MKSSTLLAFTAAALLAAGSAFAGPNCKKNKDQAPSQDEGVFEVSAEGEKAEGECRKGKCDGKKDRESAEEGVFEVAERDGEAREGKGERGERGERPDRKRQHHPLHGLDLSDEQKEDAKAIFTAAKEKAMELIKAAKENDEKPDREAMMAIRKEAMKNVYDNVLNDDQRAKLDERRAKMEERRAEGGERKGKGDGERPERPKRDKDGEGLDL